MSFATRHIGTDGAAQRAMLDGLGFGSVDDLVQAAVPASIHIAPGAIEASVMRWIMSVTPPAARIDVLCSDATSTPIAMTAPVAPIAPSVARAKSPFAV